MARKPVTPDSCVTDTHPISIVLQVLKKTGRSITRSNFQESRRRGFIHPVTKGRGRFGDRYDAVAICQAALFFDLTSRVRFHQKACSEIAYSPETKHFINKSVELARHKRQWLGDNTLIRPAAIRPPLEEMDIWFFWDLEWNIEVEYLMGAADLLRFHEKRRFSRMSLVVNALNLAYEIVAAIEDIA